MSDYSIYRQLKAGNGMAVSKYLSTGGHTLTTHAYCVEGVTAWCVKSIVNPFMVNDTAVTSGATLAAGTRICGEISSIAIAKGKAIAYCAPSPFFVQ